MADFVPQMLTPAEMQVQQQAIDRQRKIAEYLQQQSMTPEQGQMISGHYVAPHPAQYLNKLAQALIGASDQKSLDKKQLDMVNQQGDTLRAAFGLGGNAAPQMAAQDAPAAIQQGLAQGAAAGSVGPTPENLQRVAAALQGQPVPQAQNKMVLPGMDNGLAFQAYNTDPKAYLGKMMDEFKSTDAMKENRAYGINNADAGAMRRAEMLVKGTLKTSPNDVTRDPITGAMTVTPDFKSGTFGAIGPDGKPSMGAIAGSGVLADLAGAQKRAESAGSAGYNMTTVKTPNGDVMMTAEQAAALAGGQPPAGQITHGNIKNFAGLQNGYAPPMSEDLAGLQREIAMAKDPAQKAYLSGLLAAGGMPNSAGAQSATKIGIPLQSEAQRAEDIGRVQQKLSVDEAKLKNAQSQDNQQKIADARTVLDIVGMASPLIDKATNSYVGNKRDELANAVGVSTEGAKAAAQLKALGGALVSKMPKMSGPQSDKDVLLYKEMAGQIGDPTVNAENKKAAIKTITQLNMKYLADNANSISTEALNSTQRSPQQSQIDSLLKKYGGQ